MVKNIFILYVLTVMITKNYIFLGVIVISSQNLVQNLAYYGIANLYILLTVESTT